MKIKVFFFITFILNVIGDPVRPETHQRTKRNWSFNSLGNQIAQQNQYRDKPPAGGYLTSQDGKNEIFLVTLVTSCCCKLSSMSPKSSLKLIAFR